LENRCFLHQAAVNVAFTKLVDDPAGAGHLAWDNRADAKAARSVMLG
jgi:hypothetical protein